MVSLVRITTRRTRLNDARGVAILEFALVLPFLALVMIGMMEWGRMLTQYLNTVQMANDAVNLAARTHDLTPDLMCETDGDNTPTSCSGAENHLGAHLRAKRLMDLQGGQINHADPALTRYESFYDSTAQTVMFRVSSEFVALFPAFFNRIPFSVQVTGPYLPGTGLGTGANPPPASTGGARGGTGATYPPIPKDPYAFDDRYNDIYNSYFEDRDDGLDSDDGELEAVSELK